MKVTVLLFSVLRDLSGSSSLSLDVPDGAILGEVVERVNALHPALARWEGRLLLAVNGEYAGRDTVVHEGDEIALMPPVQGG